MLSMEKGLSTLIQITNTFSPSYDFYFCYTRVHIAMDSMDKWVISLIAAMG